MRFRKRKPAPAPRRTDGEGQNGEKPGDLRVRLRWLDETDEWYVLIETWCRSRWLNKYFGWNDWYHEYAVAQDWGGRSLPETTGSAPTREEAEIMGCHLLKTVREFMPAGPRNIYINEGDCK